MNFVGSPHCQSRIHCRACREDREFRESLKSAGMVEEIDFECPYLKGAGDVVALLLGPAAMISDKLMGTRLKTCGGCARRREKLNKALPFS